MNFFSTDTVFSGKFEAIDTENGIIKGVKMCSEGEAKGHGVWLNKKFISKVVELAQEQERGVKARFGHPNMCSDALGTFIGTYKNVRRKIERKEKGEETRHHAVGDLYLSKSAEKSPNGNLYDYILTLSKDHPDMFGSSIVFSGDETEDNFETEDKRILPIMGIESLFATDLVDSPAATDGLFSMNENDLASKMTEFLDTNPRIFELVSKKPQVIEEFMNKYNAYKQKHNTEDMDKTFFDEIKGMFAALMEKVTPKENTPAPENKIDLSAIEAKISQVEVENTLLTERISALEAEKQIYLDKITALEEIETKFNALEAKGTIVKGLEGQEDHEANLPEEVKSLRADMEKIKLALNPPEQKLAPINTNE